MNGMDNPLRLKKAMAKKEPTRPLRLLADQAMAARLVELYRAKAE